MLKKLLLVLSVGLFTSLTQAATNDTPEQIVRNVSREVLETIKKNEKDPAKMRDQVDAQVSPLADYPRMTSLAVGMPWRTASPEQKQALSNEFRQMLVRTYLSALTIYKNAEVDVKGVRNGSTATEQTVRTEVSLPDQKPIPVDFKFEKNANGWKVYDITVEGISFISNHRNQFKAVIQKDGIDGLIKSLSDRNAAARSK
jgi:phospholipid transport system substrate-binding protein